MTHKLRRLVHTEVIAMRWGDMDALGHVNNTVYFRYMEQTRIRFLEVAGVFYAEHPDQGMVIVNASCNFRKALVYPGVVEVRMYLGEPGRSSVESQYELRCNEELYADGAARMVWVDFQSNRSMALPERVRALLA